MLKQERPRRRRATIRGASIFGDLSLFTSLCMARIIIWRKLRDERKERLRRLKLIRLIPKPEVLPEVLKET